MNVDKTICMCKNSLVMLGIKPNEFPFDIFK